MPMIHIFEAAGLGKAPFKFSHVVTGGTHCQFCATAIVYQFWLKDANGKSFFVGSDCVMKTGDAGLIKIVEAEVKRHQKALRLKREAEKLAKIKGQLADPAVRAVLVSKPHPFSFYKDKTLADYCDYIMRYAGKAGTLKLGPIINRALAPAPLTTVTTTALPLDAAEDSEEEPEAAVS